MNESTLECIDLGDGHQVWVQTTGLRVAGRQLAGDDDTDRVSRALAMVRPAAEQLFKTLADINRPKTIEMEFGIGFSAKVGVFLASADTEANFKIKLTWENPALVTPPPVGAPADGRPRGTE